MALLTLSRRALNGLTVSVPSLSRLSWATPWRARADADAGRTGPSIAVIGNCQARGVAQAMRLLAPTSPVRFFQMAWLKREHGNVEGLARVLAGYDHVFSQVLPESLLPGGGIAGLRARDPRVTLFPTLVFPAYHPDMVYVGEIADLAQLRLVPSPLGQYHSAIALAAYRSGLGVTETAALFREDVFRRLGYLDIWSNAVQDLVGSAAAIGFGLEREMIRWSRRGNFMHVMNHPKAFVIGDIARRLLEEASFSPEPVEIEDYLGDELARDVVWPVYPPVAETYGLTGSYLFKRKQKGTTFPRLYDLEGFLAASFAIYRTRAPETLGCQRVEVWLAMPEVAAIFARG
ncbi:WcbI family polysaccharide biosynthesis putative acetyltransferase [Methylobacterium sp. A54F]